MPIREEGVWEWCREHEHTSMVAAKYGEKLTCCPSLLPLTPYLSHPYSYSVIRKQNKWFFCDKSEKNKLLGAFYWKKNPETPNSPGI